MPATEDARVLVSTATRDDAAVIRIADDRAIVATVDFFTPIVDDAYTFGAVAAANAFSDVYAMGGRPSFALNLVCWPREPDMLELLGDVVRGAVDVAREAGTSIVGGHSIDDKEPKFGLAVFGEVDLGEMVTVAGAQAGDALVLTKPVGTGVLSTALKQEMINEDDMTDAIRSMRTLNAGAAQAMRSVRRAVHAATDVTGFGLLGHLHNLLVASGVAARVRSDAVPVFPRVEELVTRHAVAGGTRRNEEAAAGHVAWDEGVAATRRTVLCDAQTSGGLLIAVEGGAAGRLVEALRAAGTPAAVVIGEVVQGPPGSITVRRGD